MHQVLEVLHNTVSLSLSSYPPLSHTYTHSLIYVISDFLKNILFSFLLLQTFSCNFAVFYFQLPFRLNSKFIYIALILDF